MFFEPKRCYRGPFYGDPHNVPTWKGHPGGEVPEGAYRIDLERAETVLEGEGHRHRMGRHGPRGTAGHRAIGRLVRPDRPPNPVPWDRDTVIDSVKKTGRCVIVHEAPKTSGFGAEPGV